MENKNGSIERDKNGVSYDSAAKYWSQIPATVEGMLGGFGFISRTDIKGSHSFLKHLFTMSNAPGRDRAADCGAGIGRITKSLLSKFFANVDLVEQNLTFLKEAKSFIRAKRTTINCFNIGLQDFAPELETYDVIWSQWVLGHLTDEHLVSFFKACKRGLKTNGIIVVKENMTSSSSVEVDYEDSSVTRPLHLFTKLYKQAGLTCIYQQKQTNFPKGIYQVIMFALRPDQQSNKLQHDNFNFDSDNLNSVINCNVNSNFDPEKIQDIGISSECEQIQENHINSTSMDFVTVENMQELCSSSTAINEIPSCVLSDEVEIPLNNENVISTACTLNPEWLPNLLPENEKHNSIKVSEVESMHHNCYIVKEEHEEVHHDMQQCFSKQPLDIQQESQTMPLEDLQVDCRSLSSEDVETTVDAGQCCRNAPPAREECQASPAGDTQQHILSADLHQVCHSLSPECIQDTILPSDIVPEECHMLTEEMQEDFTPTNITLEIENLCKPQT